MKAGSALEFADEDHRLSSSSVRAPRRRRSPPAASLPRPVRPRRSACPLRGERSQSARRAPALRPRRRGRSTRSAPPGPDRCRPAVRERRSGPAARASRRAVGRSSGTSAITSSAPAVRNRATSRLAAGTGSSAWAPRRAASAGSATPRIPTRTSPIVFSSEGTMAGDLETFTARRRGVTSPCPAPRSFSASPAAKGPSACSVFPRNLARRSLAAFSSRSRSRETTAPLRPPAESAPSARPPARARRSGDVPADHWCNRTARASADLPRIEDRHASPGLGLG